jgi:hypothetical protein
MANNAEMKFINMGPELAKAQILGLGEARPAPLTHTFFVPSGETTDLMRRLRSDGFAATEDDSSPRVVAVRGEPISVSHLKSLVREMCDIADKFAAEYDGWKIDN